MLIILFFPVFVKDAGDFLLNGEKFFAVLQGREIVILRIRGKIRKKRVRFFCMNIEKKTYKKYADAHAPSSPTVKNCIWAFCIGGVICTAGQGLLLLYRDVIGMPQKDAGTLCSVTLIFVAALLSGLGLFEKIAKRAGGGTLVPITGFANSVVSPAIDSKAEGFVLGVGAKIFTVAGPVLLYGTLAGAVYGVIYWIGTMI